MPKYWTPYNQGERNTESSPVGSEWQEQYTVEMCKGVKELRLEKEKVNIYDKIQAAAPECDVTTIIARTLAAGDEDKLAVAREHCIDLTSMPKTIHEAYHLTNAATAQFNSLPNDVRKEYGYDIDKWLADYGTDHWAGLMGFNQPNEHREEVTPNGDDQKQ